MKIWNSQMNHKIDLIKETIPVSICELVKWWSGGVWLCCVHLEPGRDNIWIPIKPQIWTIIDSPIRLMSTNMTTFNGYIFKYVESMAVEGVIGVSHDWILSVLLIQSKLPPITTTANVAARALVEHVSREGELVTWVVQEIFEPGQEEYMAVSFWLKTFTFHYWPYDQR